MSPNKKSSLSKNIDENSHSSNNETSSNKYSISVDLNNESSEVFDNEYEHDSLSNITLDPEPESIRATRTGRKIHAPSKFLNHAMHLFSLLISQCVDSSNHQIDPYKQILFFKAQLDHYTEITKLSDGTNNAFQPMALQANLLKNDTLYYGQAMKAEDSEQFKSAMRKEINNLHEADMFKIIPLEQKPKDRELIRFI